MLSFVLRGGEQTLEAMDLAEQIGGPPASFPRFLPRCGILREYDMVRRRGKGGSMKLGKVEPFLIAGVLLGKEVVIS